MEIIRQMKALEVPGRLKPAHDLLVSATYEQKLYYDAWRQNPRRAYNLKEPLIKSSSAKLSRAYRQYIKLYHAESAYNKSAFSQHLCALDAI